MDKTKSLIPEQYHAIEQIIEQTPFNDAGVSLTRLQSAEIKNLGDRSANTATLVWVRMRPGAKVGAHLHESGGEIELPLTDIISVLSNPLKEGHNHTVADGHVLAEKTEPKLLKAFMPLTVPEGVSHEFINPRDDAFADILFFLPDDHATATDKKLVASQYPDAHALEQLRARFK